MSERKQKNIFRTANTASNTKTAISSQKPTPLKHAKLKQEVLPSRNLMSQFQKLQPTPKKHLQRYKIGQDKDVQSSINESSELSSEIYIQNETKIDFRQQGLKFQLPKSYIIAMGGLQEAVKQRENQLNNLNLKFQEQKRKRQSLEDKAKELQTTLKQLQKTKQDLTSQIKFQRQVNLREKQNHQSNQKMKNEYQMELAISKEKLTQELCQLKRIVDQLEVQKRVAVQNNQQNLTQKQTFFQQIQLLKLKQAQNTQKFTQTKTSLNTQIQRLEKQLDNQRKMRLEAQKQIAILKKQLSLLAERTVIAEKKEVDFLFAQKSYLDAVENNTKLRIPLMDVPTANRPNQNKSKEQIKVNIKKQLPSSQEQKKDIPKLTLHAKKPTDISILSRERSTSRIKNNTQRPQIISQYRQLLRYQKESIALNYQLQLIQKSLASKSSGEGRTELQRSYQKLKREAQQKQLQIRQLKCILNDSKK